MEVVPTTIKKATETINKDTSNLAITDQTVITGVETKIKIRDQSITMAKNIASLLVAMLTKLLNYQVVLRFRKTFTLKVKNQKIDHKKKSMSTWLRIK